MKKMIFLIPFFVHAVTIGELFDAVKKIPDSKIDALSVKETKTAKKEVSSKYLPSVSFVASAEHYNIPYSIRPLPPTEATILIKQNKPLPFGQNIEKFGLTFEMPIFIKSLNDTQKKMGCFVKAKKYQQKLNLIKREALLVNALSNLDYLNSLIKALKAKKESIQTTLKAIMVGVNAGAIPKFDAEKLKDAINQININIQNIKIQKAKTQQIIYTLTKMKVDGVDFHIVKKVNKGEFFSLKPMMEKAKAAKIDIAVAKDSYYPQLALKAAAMRNFTKAYNNKKNTAANVANIGIYLKWDILNFSNRKKIQKSRIIYQKNILEIEKTRKDLNAEIMQINESLKHINKALVSELNSISIKKELLKSAKVAFKLREMSVKDYLSYETDLADAKAQLAKLMALRNSLIAQKAFIYGKNLERIFK